MDDLSEIIQKEYALLAGNIPIIIKDEGFFFIEFKYDNHTKYQNNILSCSMVEYPGEKMLYTFNLSVLPDSRNAELFNKILSINYNIAQKAGFKQIRAEAMDNEEGDLLIKAGYTYNSDEYIGVKKVE